MADPLCSFYQTGLLLSWLLLALERPVAIKGQGVFVELNGVRLLNDSLVDIDDIPDETIVTGAGEDSLNCNTNLVACCNSALEGVTEQIGHWYDPDGSEVLNNPNGGTTFRRTRGRSVVRMWRRGTPSQRGRFYCEVPNSQDVNQIRFVNILDIGAVSVSPAGTTNRTVGENFNLQCSVDITTNPLPRNVPTPSFEWFFGSTNASLPSGVTVSSVTISGNTSTSTLQFSPLRESHAGMYTCRLGGNARLANNAVVSVNLPAPTVTITSNPPSPILDGTNVTVTCSVTMGQGVLPSDLSLLMVNTQLSRDGTTLALTGPVVSGTTFTYTIQLNSFGRNDSGIYVCTVNVTLWQPSTYLTGMGYVTAISEIVIVVSPPLNVQASQSSASTPVEVSWSPPSGGAATITGYRIFYGNGDNVVVPSTPITSVGLIFNENAVGQRVSIRSESGKVTSELINVTITADLTKSCSAEVGIAVGLGNLLILCLVAIVIIVITLICCWRKEKTSFDLPGNVSQSVYEEPDKLASSGQGNYELTQCPAYESTTSKPQPQPTEDQSSHYEM